MRFIALNALSAVDRLRKTLHQSNPLRTNLIVAHSSLDATYIAACCNAHRFAIDEKLQHHVYDAAMRLKLVQAGEPVLRAPAQPLTAKEITSREILRLIDDMHETLQDAPGVGLAAPQVGVPLQLAIIEDRPEYSRDIATQELAERERVPVPFHVIINPELKPIGKAQVEFFEGCLSLNGFTALVPRYRQVRVTCLDERGKQRRIEASGWYARILQHEIDHLKSTLYIDRMRSRSFSSLENFSRHWKRRGIKDVIADLK